MTSAFIDYERRGSVALLTFARPDQLNAMSGAMVEEILAAIATAADDPAIRALVLRGAGGNFMAGADIKAYATQSAEAFRDFQESAGRVYGALEALPKPVIAAVEGYALGGGFEIALSADLIVTHPEAKLGLPEVKLGLVPGGGGTQRLARKLGPNRAAELLMTGRFASAQEMADWGVVNRVADDTLGEALALAEQMARHPAGALADLKKLNLAAWQTGLEAGLEAERDAVCALFLTGDGMQRIRDFVTRSEHRKAEGAKA
ncbi:MAG: enoyl-CoA hydratase/isomerase family protein [Bosea sp. (in: a-proteobacteria)]|uniref:enoyl-CoA hydratase/isomerase family protein n=1 Tax=Bosea sp. (in: a-proteobacteria) TaxID=1871050 RepID=UPI003F7C8C34